MINLKKKISTLIVTSLILGGTVLPAYANESQ